jgi:hypothetical protein
VTYFDLLEIRSADPRQWERLYHERCYSYIEGILDARRALNIRWNRDIRRSAKLLHKAQRTHAIALWMMGDDQYESWVPWYKLLARRE